MLECRCSCWGSLDSCSRRTTCLQDRGCTGWASCRSESALSLLYGGLARLGGAALCLLWLIGAGVVGLESMLENAHYLGFGAFFMLTGRGPYAVDRLLFPALEPTPQLSRLAMPCLRIGTGLGLMIVAFTEKLANPELARAFLQQHPLNFTGWLHIPMSDDIFMLCAGSTELVIGLCLIFGIFPRLIVASAWVLINMSLTVFNWVELVGHLPLYGVMAMLLVWTPARGRPAAVGRRCPQEMSGACGGAANAGRCVIRARPRPRAVRRLDLRLGDGRPKRTHGNANVSRTNSPSGMRCGTCRAGHVQPPAA